MPAWPLPNLRTYQLTPIRLLLSPTHHWGRNPRHYCSLVYSQGFRKPHCDHATCWRRTFRGMRESRTPPICTAHPSTPQQTLPCQLPNTGHCFHRSLVQVFLVRFHNLHPQLMGCLLSEALLDPPTGFAGLVLGSNGTGTPIYSVYLSNGGTLPMGNRHCARGVPNHINRLHPQEAMLLRVCWEVRHREV